MPLLKRGNCTLRESDHRYLYDPHGTPEIMRTSVTAVCKYFDPPVDYSRYPEAAPRGTHVHLAGHHLAWDNIILRECMRKEAEGDEEAWEAPPDSFLQFMDNDGHISPEGIDCWPWIEQIQCGRLHGANHEPLGDRRMSDFWCDVEVLATEHTMVSRRRSLGGQLDLLYRNPQGRVCLADFKTKSKSWNGASAKDRQDYSRQFGGYLWLLANGNDHHTPIPYVDECRTIIVRPDRIYILPPLDPNECSLDFEACWDAYEAAALALPF